MNATYSRVNKCHQLSHTPQHEMTDSTQFCYNHTSLVESGFIIFAFSFHSPNNNGQSSKSNYASGGQKNVSSFKLDLTIYSDQNRWGRDCSKIILELELQLSAIQAKPQYQGLHWNWGVHIKNFWAKIFRSNFSTWLHLSCIQVAFKLYLSCI